MTPTVLHLDPETVVVDKPAGLASIPEEAPDAPCALGLVAAELGGDRLWRVHRLDKATSGVLLFARNATVHRHYCRAFEHRKVHKVYLAVVAGVVKEDAGTWDAPLRLFGSGRTAVDYERGKTSRTDFRVVRRGPDRTWLQLELHSGRQHQIRAHAYHAGHPVLGDPRYGDRTNASAAPRLLLHALTLGFPHPTAGWIEVTAPVPAEMA